MLWQGLVSEGPCVVAGAGVEGPCVVARAGTPCAAGAGVEGGAWVSGARAGCSTVGGPVAVAGGALFWMDKEGNCRGALKGKHHKVCL